MEPGNILLEKYLLGEITENEMKSLKAEYPDQKKLIQEIEKLKVSNAEILEKYKPSNMADSIKKRMAQEEKTEGRASDARSFSVFRIVRYAAAAAAATLFLVFGLTLYNQPTDSGNYVAASEELSSERVKGLKPSLKIYRRKGDTAEILANRDAVAEKDLLQIEYIAGSFKYGVIFSIDGRGTVTLHFPTYSGVAAELDNNGAVLLPYAYELDDAPGFERFFFITGGNGFDVNEVLDAAYELASKGQSARREFLDIPDLYYQTTILLKKEAE